MTIDQLRTVKIGDNVRLERFNHTVMRGRVTQETRTWFMVMWSDGVPEVIRREVSILTSCLHLEPK